MQNADRKVRVLRSWSTSDLAETLVNAPEAQCLLTPRFSVGIESERLA